MTIAAASALVPQLNHRPRDLGVETSALAAIAIWAVQFTPVVSLEPPAGLLLEIEGSLKLLGGIDNVLQSIERGLQDMGYTAAIACASTATAAWLLARTARASRLPPRARHLRRPGDSSESQASDKKINPALPNQSGPPTAETPPRRQEVMARAAGLRIIVLMFHCRSLHHRDHPGFERD